MMRVILKTTGLMWLCLLLGFAVYAQPGKGRLGGKQAPTDKTNLVIAKEYLKFEEYQKALPYVDKLLDEQPDNPYYNYWMGKCLFFSYKKNMALSHFEKVNKVNPQIDPDFHYYYALALHYSYDFKRAREEYKLAIEEFRPKSEGYEDIQKRIAQCDYGQQQMDNKNQDWERIFIENTGPNINSEYAEHSPVISANDSVLLYTARRPECLGAIPSQHYYDEDLYVSFKHGDIWSKGTNIGRPVNSPGHDATISLTADGRTLYILSLIHI